MTSEELIDIASQWMKSFNEKQLDQLLSLYDEAAEHYSPKLKVRHPETNGLIKARMPCVRGGKIRLIVFHPFTMGSYDSRLTTIVFLWNTHGT